MALTGPIVYLQRATKAYVETFGHKTLECAEITMTLALLLLLVEVPDDDVRIVEGHVDVAPDEGMTGIIDGYHCWLRIRGDTFDPKDYALKMLKVRGAYVNYRPEAKARPSKFLQDRRVRKEQRRAEVLLKILGPPSLIER